MSLPGRPSIYEQLRPHLDASDLIVRLGLHEARRLGSEAYCRPLCHESTSGESLQINLHTGRWNCKACQHNGVRGDLIQLVEYVLTGGRPPSHGEAQGGSESHREAVRWLCEQYGIAYSEGRNEGDPALDVVHLFAMQAHEHLLQRQEVLSWIQEQWGFDRETVEAYGLGFMPSPMLPALLQEARRPQSMGAFKASGLGWFTKDGQWHSRFEGRVLFPYLENGRAVYLIGRATPWTPTANGAPPPKYHKLSVHSETRPWISERITNDHLYNEPVMSAADEIGVLEGVADAVAISALGVPAVSPVTVNFNAADLERFVRKCRDRGIRRIWILFDNELSGSGNWAARRSALKLIERGLVVSIVTLPLGPEQDAARKEIIRVLGHEAFAELERSDPIRRKELLVEKVPDLSQREWVKQQIAASKIDAAEWCAAAGAAAPGKFDALRRAARDAVDLEIQEVEVDMDEPPAVRLGCFSDLIDLVAHVEDTLQRNTYAGAIAKAAGRGVTKGDVASRIAQARRVVVKPKREKEKLAEREDKAAAAVSLVVPPPEAPHTTPQPPKPPSPSSDPGAPAAPLPPAAKPQQSDHERYASARDSVNKGVDAKLSPEQIGEYVSQIITISMGFTPFRTPDELFLVRGNERIPVGMDRPTARFESLLFLASGLTPKKSSHRAYIAAVVYFLENASRRVADVSWSYVDPDGAVYFPTGDEGGRILKIEVGRVSRTRMSEARVPCVAGADFVPFRYVEEPGGVDAAMRLFDWTSISPSSRLVLVHWLVCLPILRRVGTVPIVRIEGGSSSGKTRTVESVSYLVNGRKGSSVPTAAALVSRMSTEMLTVDDNRETIDVSQDFLGTLLQATHLGAREKRKANSDTGTVIERVCGALLMNGVEPIHDGRSELASRILVLRCDSQWRRPDSPRSERTLRDALVGARDGFWSEAVRLCAIALELDSEHGESLGAEIEELFGATKIGRLSAYLRLMYLTWVARQPVDQQAEALEALAGPWRSAFQGLADHTLDSLLKEELAVTCLRYAFAYGQSLATGSHHGFGGEVTKTAFGERYVETPDGEIYLGPLRATRLAQIVREAGKELNAPTQVAHKLRAGQLEQRILDGLDFLQAAGFEVSIEVTQAGRRRFTFRRTSGRATPPPPAPGGDTWTGF